MKKIILILILLLCFITTGYSADLFGTYDQRIKITIDHTKIDSALSDFPVTVFFTDSQAEEIFTEFDADSDYMKCAFTTSDGSTELYAEKELFDDSEQEAIYHVKVTSISSSSDTDIYYYYDNDASDNTSQIGAIDSTAGGNVWDSSYKFVCHMVDATTSTVLDSTSNNNDGAKKGANEPVEAAGQVGQAQDFDGTDDYISPGAITVGDNGTIELWMSNDDLAQASGVVSNLGYETLGDAVHFSVSGGNVDIRTYNDSSIVGRATATNANIGLTLSTWFHLGGTWADGQNLKLYGNGEEPSEYYLQFAGGSGLAWTNALYLGGWAYDSERYEGKLDEVRISNVVRTAAWIKATYNTGNDSLLTYGSEEIGVTANALMFGMAF